MREVNIFRRDVTGDVITKGLRVLRYEKTTLFLSISFVDRMLNHTHTQKQKQKKKEKENTWFSQIIDINGEDPLALRYIRLSVLSYSEVPGANLGRFVQPLSDSMLCAVATDNIQKHATLQDRYFLRPRPLPYVHIESNFYSI